MALHRRTPDDVMTYGYIAEADIALGNYSEAETNAQWMMNMRPNNTPALLVGAKLRALYGDAHGAIEFLNRAFSQTSPIEVEDLAWIANQIASIQIDSGQIDAAAADSGAGRAGISSLSLHNGESGARPHGPESSERCGSAVLMQAASIDNDPHVLFELARAQEAAGQARRLGATYAEFERLASDAGRATDASRLDLILMYAGSPATAPNALKLAQQEIAARQDVWTLDAYAWALYANAKYQDADAADAEGHRGWNPKRSDLRPCWAISRRSSTTARRQQSTSSFPFNPIPHPSSPPMLASAAGLAHGRGMTMARSASRNGGERRCYSALRLAFALRISRITRGPDVG